MTCGICKSENVDCEKIIDAYTRRELDICQACRDRIKKGVCIKCGKKDKLIEGKCYSCFQIYTMDEVDEEEAISEDIDVSKLTDEQFEALTVRATLGEKAILDETSRKLWLRVKLIAMEVTDNNYVINNMDKIEELTNKYIKELIEHKYELVIRGISNNQCTGKVIDKLGRVLIVEHK